MNPPLTTIFELMDQLQEALKSLDYRQPRDRKLAVDGLLKTAATVPDGASARRIHQLAESSAIAIGYFGEADVYRRLAMADVFAAQHRLGTAEPESVFRHAQVSFDDDEPAWLAYLAECGQFAPERLRAPAREEVGQLRGQIETAFAERRVRGDDREEQERRLRMAKAAFSALTMDPPPRAAGSTVTAEEKGEAIKHLVATDVRACRHVLARLNPVDLWLLRPGIQSGVLSDLEGWLASEFHRSDSDMAGRADAAENQPALFRFFLAALMNAQSGGDSWSKVVSLLDDTPADARLTTDHTPVWNLSVAAHLVRTLLLAQPAERAPLTLPDEWRDGDLKLEVLPISTEALHLGDGLDNCIRTTSRTPDCVRVARPGGGFWALCQMIADPATRLFRVPDGDTGATLAEGHVCRAGIGESASDLQDVLVLEDVDLSPQLSRQESAACLRLLRSWLVQAALPVWQSVSYGDRGNKIPTPAKRLGYLGHRTEHLQRLHDSESQLLNTIGLWTYEGPVDTCPQSGQVCLTPLT